jgi:superfamily I DNA/RNA helicase
MSPLHVLVVAAFAATMRRFQREVHDLRCVFEGTKRTAFRFPENWSRSASRFHQRNDLPKPLHWGKAADVTAEELAEERRLFYVGMTRAKDRLVLSRALKRLWLGRVQTQAPSPFLADIESELLKEQQSTLRRRRDDRQLKLL